MVANKQTIVRSSPASTVVSFLTASRLRFELAEDAIQLLGLPHHLLQHLLHLVQAEQNQVIPVFKIANSDICQLPTCSGSHRCPAQCPH